MKKNWKDKKLNDITFEKLDYAQFYTKLGHFEDLQKVHFGILIVSDRAKSAWYCS